MIKQLAAILCLISCHSDPSGHLSPEPKENVALVKHLCPSDAYPMLSVGRTGIACCVGSVDVWYPDKCIGAHPSDLAKENFCDQTPIGGHLYINRTGEWWCCNAGQCGN